MPIINAQAIQKVAKLARLSHNLSEDDLAKYTAEIESILEYTSMLNEIDTTQISPTDGWRTNTIDELREDVSDSDTEDYQRVRQNIISNFPHKQNNLLILPGIFENS